MRPVTQAKVRGELSSGGDPCRHMHRALRAGEFVLYNAKF